MDFKSTFVAILSSLMVLSGLVAGQSRSIVDVTPVDTVVEMGQSVMLKCETTIEDHEVDNLEWKEYITKDTGTTIFNSFKPEEISDPKFEIHGEYNLEVKNTAVEDGGLYSCKLTLGEDSSNEADLVIIEAPEITLPEMIENDTYPVSCKTMYGSQKPEELAEGLVPKMKVALGNQIVAVPSVLTPGEPGPSGEYRPSILQASANVTAKWDFNEKDFTCEVFTDDPHFKVVSNQTVNVKFPVRNIRTSPPPEAEYEVGSIIQCLADGNPAPDYDWKPINSKISAAVAVENGSLVVVQDMIGEHQIWECMASNTVRNYEALTIKVEFDAIEPKNPSGGSGADSLAGSIMMTFCALLILAWALH